MWIIQKSEEDVKSIGNKYDKLFFELDLVLLSVIEMINRGEQEMIHKN